ELRDEKNVEDADPEIERDRDRRALARERVKNEQVRDEKQRDPCDQPDAVHFGREISVRRDGEKQEQRLAGGGVGLHLGAAAGKDQRLAHGLDDEIRREKKKKIQHQQQRSPRLARAHVGEQAEKAVERGLALCHELFGLQVVEAPAVLVEHRRLV